MNESIIIRLRKLWKQKNLKEFQKLYNLGKWMLSKNEINAIEKALEHKTIEQSDLLKYVLKIIPGSKIIK